VTKYDFEIAIQSIQKSVHSEALLTRERAREDLETFGTQTLGTLMETVGATPYANPRRAEVDFKRVSKAVHGVLGRRYNPEKPFTSPEQAELINSVDGSQHVLGVIETGGGKSMAFFCAPFLFPESLFLVITPLVALKDDIRRRLLETSIKGGVWGEDEIDPHTAQLVIVSVDMAATDSFRQWITSEGIRKRLKRIFIDEVHKMTTDDKYRPAFTLLLNVCCPAVHITGLSGSLMARSIPKILDMLQIKDLALVDEIRRYTGRSNLKYLTRQIKEKDYLREIVELVQKASGKMGIEDRGIIFLDTKARTAAIAEALQCPQYTGDTSPSDRILYERKWRLGHKREDRWMAATGAFGQGVDYAHVRTVIHFNPQEFINFVQETARSGRDGEPAVCYCLYSKIPKPMTYRSIHEDYTGRTEMIAFLTTKQCLRLVFAPLDSIAHSCGALMGSKTQLCGNCEQKSVSVSVYYY
jgi:superfamily II DNA helicase RecQ